MFDFKGSTNNITFSLTFQFFYGADDGEVSNRLKSLVVPRAPSHEPADAMVQQTPGA